MMYVKIEYCCGDVVLVYGNTFRFSIDDIVSINFHDKTEITRPIHEAIEADIGKICRFWDDKGEEFFGRLGHIGDKYFTMIAPVYEDLQFLHCRRLTKQEIEELC